MKVINKEILLSFWQLHRDAEGPLKAWIAEAKNAHWQQPSDIIGHYSNARTLPNGRIIWNIKSNNYRLVVHANYRVGTVFVRFIGTHAEYDKIDAERY
jgi:mRNA interferase HigB